MERRTKKMLLAILMIISVLAADFFVLGSGIMTYASELSSETNNANVQFSVYFKEGENRVDSTQKSIKTEDVKLYAEIKVKNEGYLKEGTVIELENSNFNLKSEIIETNTHINSIEGNKVNLKQINAGETVEIELGIEPIIADKIETEFLSKVSKVKMIGSYVYSKDEEGQSIRTDKEVCINYQPDDTTNAELTAEIITNKELLVSGTNKRIVQLLIKSRITNNEYPVKQTKISADVPVINGEKPEVTAMAINELATNGTTEINDIKIADGEVEITIENNPDVNNQISWNKNIYDEVVITYIYSEEVKASDVVFIDSSVLMNVYNYENPYMAMLKTNQALGQTIPESNNVIIGRNEITTKELYKGKLYTKSELTYNTKSEIVITEPNVVEEVVIHEGPDKFGTTESEISANTKYISTEINLEKMLEIVGQDGNIEIKSGETRTLINKETEVDANGNVVINYENGTSELYITTSNPVKAGILELKHTKVIAENNYTRAQLQEVKTLIAKGSLEGTITVEKEKQNVISKETESGLLELKETISKAELTIENNKTELSTTEENEITLGITLVTNSEQYDLYKNPKISLKFPEAVENVELIAEPTKQNMDEFTVSVGEYNATKKTMQIDLQGEQVTFADSEFTQSYLQLNLKVTLSALGLAKTDKIMMAYTNENSILYEDGRTDAGISEQAIQISAPSQLIKFFNISANENISTTETILQQIKENNAGKTLEFGISLINNQDSDISNLKILGKLPTTENVISGDENTLETTLKGIIAENATIYYTENSSATVNVEDTTNGWTQDLATLTNAKLYLIKVDSLARGETYNATLNVQIPNVIEPNALSYTQYGVIYDTASKTDIKESSRKIGLVTSMAANIKTEITAQVGQDILQDGDVVKEGEVIKYTVTVKNEGKIALENVQLKLDVPEGTTYVQPLENYVYADGYYDEITDSDKLDKLTNISISQLTTTENFIAEYEVRVNKGAANKEISNIPIVVYNESEIANSEFNNIIEAANVRVSIKRTSDASIQLHPGKISSYMLYIENLSDLAINNLSLQLISDTLQIEAISNLETTFYGDEIQEKVNIDEIKANDKIYFYIQGRINDEAKSAEIRAVVNDEQLNTYRSNKVEEMLPSISATMNMSSPQDAKYIEEGEIVEYNIIVKNTGDIEECIKIETEIPDILKIESIDVNGKNEKQSINAEDAETYIEKISNKIELEKMVDVNNSAEIKITTRVRHIPNIYNGNIINTQVQLSSMNVIQGTSPIIKHVLKSSDADGKIENIISGAVWFDEDKNGQIDVNEEFLQDISVKLYDISAQEYLKDEGASDLRVLTDENGRYEFTEIKNGSYLVIFEYDTEKYALTTPYAKNVESSRNSKTSIKTITGDKYIIRVASIEINNFNGNAFDMNLGLRENTGEISKEEQPGIEEIITKPEEPENPDKPTDTEKPEQPENPEKPTDTETPEEQKDLKTISGIVWLDSNNNGQKDKEDSFLSEIKVRLYNIHAKDYLTDESGKIVEIKTDSNGKYKFDNIEKGSYIVIVEYNAEEYKLITKNSNIVTKKININGQEVTVAVTDAIEVQENISNINIGLKENLKFDLELNKYISKIVVQTSEKTKAYDYEGKTLGKVEIHRKQIQGALVVLEYTITVKNTGEIAGYAKNIVDYVPSGLTFSSELNTDWYLSGNNLYTKSIENTLIKPGEEKEIKLILTKTMTNENVGLINNRAEIYQDYNKNGEPDIDSTPNNQSQNEDDFGTTDVIISVATGGSTMAYIILVIINITLIYVAIRIMIKNGIIEIKTKEERR